MNKDLLGEYPDVLSVEETACLLSLSKSWLYKQIAKDKKDLPNECPPYFRVGRKILFMKMDLLTWLSCRPGKSSFNH